MAYWLFYVVIPERVFPNRLCLTVAEYQPGWNRPLRMSRIKSTCWPRRVWCHQKLVRQLSFCFWPEKVFKNSSNNDFFVMQAVSLGILMEWHRSDLSLEARFYVFWRPRDSPRTFPRTSISLLRRPSLSGSTWSVTGWCESSLRIPCGFEKIQKFQEYVNICYYRKDKDSKFRLILVESRIHRLARYYKTKRVLAPNWKYESSTASALVA